MSLSLIAGLSSAQGKNGCNQLEGITPRVRMLRVVPLWAAVLHKENALLDAFTACVYTHGCDGDIGVLSACNRNGITFGHFS